MACYSSCKTEHDMSKHLCYFSVVLLIIAGDLNEQF